MSSTGRSTNWASTAPPYATACGWGPPQSPPESRAARWPRPPPTPPDATSSAALTCACDAAVDVAAAAPQVHGGYGHLKEYPAEHHVRDAVSLRAAVDAAGIAVSEAARLVGMP
ncbi:acyl-CoA dehydrogenase family protein [Streptomyces malaysiensis]|uniref:acyl-CoA dehydrogenase family protein n=1 Tax=Streptomyces malaysiensis TaxID=92644 RepID=UPI0011CDA34A